MLRGLDPSQLNQRGILLNGSAEFLSRLSTIQAFALG